MPCAPSLVLHTVLAPVSRSALYIRGSAVDELGLATYSKSENGGDFGTCRPQVTSVGDLPASSVSALQLVPGTLRSEPTPPVYEAKTNAALVMN